MFRVFLAFFPLLVAVNACSNIIVSPGASADKSSLVAYNADSGSLYGSLYHYPAADHPEGSQREVYDWDSGRYLGNIPEAAHTYNVVGNMNEFGLTIGETTYGGIEALQSQSKAKIDYGSLIWITLQRSKNAREAIQTIAELMSTYGYASEGESFSIADGKEAWIMEIIGKGEYELGAVWVAMKLPEGSISAHANQARIRTFPLNDPDNCLYAPDVISFARKIGLFDANAPDASFSFSDIYDPVTFSGARSCEARVWSVFSSVMGPDWSAQYLSYAQGYNLTNRMPLFVYPPKDQKLSVSDVSALMRNHYENTPLDMSGTQFSDVGAYTNSIYRTHPLTWTSSVNPVDGQSHADAKYQYVNERPIATPQTGWNFIAQTRDYLPAPLKGLLWFGVDDVSTTVRTPVYAAATVMPKAYVGKGPQDGVVPPMMTFSWDQAYYVFNVVANFAYSRWDLVSPDVLAALTKQESKLLMKVQDIDATVMSQLESYAIENPETTMVAGAKVPSESIAYLSTQGVLLADQLIADWTRLFGELFVKYRDGYVITAQPSDTACGCSVGNQGYPQAWYDRIVRDTGDHYYVPGSGDKVTQKKDARLLPVPKSSLKALR